MNRRELIDLAIKKGFKKDSIINARWLKPNCKPLDWMYEYYEHSDCLFFGTVLIYEKNKWADIL